MRFESLINTGASWKARSVLALAFAALMAASLDSDNDKALLLSSHRRKWRLSWHLDREKCKLTDRRYKGNFLFIRNMYSKWGTLCGAAIRTDQYVPIKEASIFQAKIIAFKRHLLWMHIYTHTWREFYSKNCYRIFSTEERIDILPHFLFCYLFVS